MSGGQRLAFTNARLLDPDTQLDASGTLLVEGGEILDVGPRLFAAGVPSDLKAVDCGGCCLAPGLIDMRVNLPGEENAHKESIETVSIAAAAGGVTEMFCLPNPDLPLDSVEVIEFIARRACEIGVVGINAYGAVTRGLQGKELAEMGILAEAGAVAFTDGNRAVSNALVMHRALSYAATFDVMVIQHPEEPALSSGGQINEGTMSARLGLAGIPAAAEVMMIERDLRLVELTGARYHAAHISTANAINAIRDAKSRGLPVSCDTAPHYFVLNEEAVEDYRTFAKVSPPLREEADRLAVIEGLLDGTIDVIASDHCPQDQDLKRLPFVQAEPGIIGLETLMPLTLRLHHDYGVGLPYLLRRLTSEPARLLGMKKGRLLTGYSADFILFDPDCRWKIDTETMYSKSGNSPFDGFQVVGRVLQTYSGGKKVWDLAPGSEET